jgi:nitroreductase
MAIETAAEEDRAREPLIVRLRRRRVTRDFTNAPVAEERVRLVLEGGRWATSGSNLRLHRFVVVEDAIDLPPVYAPVRLNVVDDATEWLHCLLAHCARDEHDDEVWDRLAVSGARMLAGLLEKRIAPGILGNPTVLIVICTDLQRCREVGARPDADRTRYIDVGTAAMNMLLVAQDLGLGACPVTSFSQRAVAILLDLPATLIPELMVLLGHPVLRSVHSAREHAPASPWKTLALSRRRIVASSA